MIIISIGSYGQYSEEFTFYEEAYPNADFVRLNYESIIHIELIDEKVVMTQETNEENLYLNDKATYFSNEELSFSSFFELNEIKASSYLFEGSKYREKEVEKFVFKDDLDGSFHSDIKLLNFIYPDLKKGSMTSLHYTEVIKNPRFSPTFFLGDFYPIINNKIKIIVDNNINVRFQEFNTSGMNLNYKKEVQKKKTTHSWEVKDVNKFESEKDAPNYRSYLPHIIPIITSYKTKNEQIKLLDNVSGLYKWYYSLIKNINTDEPENDLVKLVHEIIKDKNNDSEKVKAIYYWVQKNIKYIDFEHSLGGFIPREANEIYVKKYGDCKDNTSILLKMLEIADITGNYTWIGTRSIPYSYQDVPTPIVDNHMILTYQSKDSIYFLDATGRYIPFGFPTSFIQGKEALVSHSEKDFSILKVPILSADKSKIEDVTTIDIIDGSVFGTSRTSISGYHKINYLYNLENVVSEEKIKTFYNKKFQKGNNKFLIDSLLEKNKFDYDLNLIVDYTFSIQDYVNQVGDELYINLNLNKVMLNYIIEEDREHDIEYDFKNSYKFKTIFNIPKEYTVTFVPKNLNLENDFMTCNTIYSVDKEKVVYEHIISLKFLKLNLEQQRELTKIVKKTNSNYNEVIVLQKNN